MNNKIVFAIFSLISLILSINFGTNGVWFFIFSVFVGVTVLLYSPEEESKLVISKYFFIVPFLLFMVSRLLPFYLYGPHPLGYDTGFYKYNISKERSGSLGGVHLSEVELTGSRLITKGLIGIGLSDNEIMYGFYILICLLIGLFVYLLTNLHFGETAAFFSVFAYSISFVQFLAYWDMFWKNAIGVFLILAIFYLLEKKKLYYQLSALPLVGLVFITHKTSAVLLCLTLTAYYLFQKNKVKYYLLPVLFIITGIVAWNNRILVVYLWEQLISGFSAHYDFFAVKEGIFIESQQFLGISYSFFYLPFAILSIISILSKKRNNLILTFLLICAIFVIAKLIFYKRIFAFLDIGLIILFGYSFSLFIKKIGSATSIKYRNWFLVILLVFPTSLFIENVINQKSLISKTEIKNIESLKDLAPSLRILTYSSYYTPWLYGFSGHKIIAPGWGDDKWTLEKWNKFWNVDMESKKTMLGDLQQPFLIYDNGDGFFNFTNDDCFNKLESNVYIFNCNK